MAPAKQATQAPPQEEEFVNSVLDETASVAPPRYFTIPGRDPFAPACAAFRRRTFLESRIVYKTCRYLRTIRRPRKRPPDPAHHPPRPPHLAGR